MNKKIYYTIITIFFILVIIIRMWNWPYFINDINCDEAMTALNAKSIAENGKDIYGTTYPVYFESWVYGGQSAFAVYFISIFIKVFGFSLISVRLPILIITILGLLFTFLLVDKIFDNKKISIIILGLLAINPWNIMQSQWVLDCNFFPHVFVIAIYLLYIGVENKNNKFLISSMIVFALTLYTYGIALYLVPVLLLIIAIYLLKNKRINIKKILLCISIFIIFSFPIICMTIINLFDLPTIKIGKITIQNFTYVTRTNDMLIFSNNIIKTLISNIKCLNNILFLQNDGLIWNSIPKFGTIYLISLPIVIYAIVIVLYCKLKNKNEYNEFGIFLIITWLAVSILCGLLINGININRLNIIWYVLIILNGLGIYKIIEQVRNKKVIIVVITIIYVINFICFMYCYYTNGRKNITKSYTWSQGLVDAIEYVEDFSVNKVILSSNAANSDKQDIFIRYATKLKQEKKFIQQEEFLKYYTNKEDLNMNFSTNEKEYIIQELNNDLRLTEKIYIITAKDYSKINNINNYEEKQYNNYIVLVEK